MDNENMRIYSQLEKTPDNAKKKIGGGRLSGMTDVNPMYRIKKLTETFGAAGIGWYTEEIGRHTETCQSGEVMCFLDINLYIRDGEEWSKPIYGTGGSMLVASEKNGLRANDEGWKMAYTDALSVACKALGMAADVYWEAGVTKYTQPASRPEQDDSPVAQYATAEQLATINNLFPSERITAMLKTFKISELTQLTQKQAEFVIKARKKEMERNAEN